MELVKKNLWLHIKSLKKIVDSKSAEKQIDKEFYEVSHYSIYQVVKAAKEQDFIRLGK